MAARARSAPRRYRRPSPMPQDRAMPARADLLATLPRYSCLTPAGAIDQRGGAMALQYIDQQNLAATGLDDLVADDLLAGIVAALDQHARFHPRDQLDRGVLFENRDQIDRLQRCQHFGAGALVLHRTPLALQPLHRGVAVQPDDQAITGTARRRQHLD